VIVCYFYPTETDSSACMSQRGAKVCLYFPYGGLDLRVSESTRSEGVLIVGHAGIERPFFHGVKTEVTNLKVHKNENFFGFEF